MRIEVRQAIEADLKQLRQLSISTFCNAYERYNTKEDMEMYLRVKFDEVELRKEWLDPNCVFLVAEYDHDLVGYAKLGLFPEKGKVNVSKPIEIIRFYAAVEFIGKGVGKLLMQAVVQFAGQREYEAIQLDVWQRNPVAIEFYKKWDFKIVGQTTFRLGNDIQDDHIMLLKLK